MISNKSGYTAFEESYGAASQALEKLITKCQEEDVRAPMKAEFEALVESGVSPEEAFEIVTEDF